MGLKEWILGLNVYDDMNGLIKKNMLIFDIVGRLKDYILLKIWICLIYIL